MVYLIYNKKRNSCKIGCSNNPERRLADLQTSNSDSLELLFTKEGSFIEESILHEKYKDQLIRGEWFNYIPEMSIDFLGFETDIHYSIIEQNISDIYKILNGCEIKVITYCAINCNYENNNILINKTVVEKIKQELNISESSIKNAIVELTKKGVLSKNGTCLYNVNEKYFRYQKRG